MCLEVLTMILILPSPLAPPCLQLPLGTPYSPSLPFLPLMQASAKGTIIQLGQCRIVCVEVPNRYGSRYLYCHTCVMHVTSCCEQSKDNQHLMLMRITSGCEQSKDN